MLRPARLLLPLVLALGLLAAPELRVAACDCASWGPEDALAAADVAFAGTVVAVSEAAVGARPAPAPAVAHDFAVDGVARGDLPAMVRIMAGGDQAACGMSFGMGERWLIFAWRERGGLTTHLCGGNIRLERDQEPPIPITPVEPPAGGQGPPPLPVLLTLGAVLGLAAVSLLAFRLGARPPPPV